MIGRKKAGGRCLGPRAVLIAGPTASGKSALAVELAERLGGVVINADSMQVYRELRVLTARPGTAELARAPHRLYGVVGAAERFSVGRWLELAAAAIETAEGERKVPILVGGTGLYFTALAEGLAEVPEVPGRVRAKWRRRLEAEGPEALQAELAARDRTVGEAPAMDPQRALRALEVVDFTGRPLAEWQAAGSRPVLPPEGVRRLVLAPPRSWLKARIAARAETMFAGGAVEEAAALLALGLPATAPAMKAIGVRQIAAHLAGEIDRDEARARTAAASRQYAKRQTTWFRGRMADWQHIEGEGDFTETVTALLERC